MILKLKNISAAVEKLVTVNILPSKQYLRNLRRIFLDPRGSSFHASFERTSVDLNEIFLSVLSRSVYLIKVILLLETLRLHRATPLQSSTLRISLSASTPQHRFPAGKQRSSGRVTAASSPLRQPSYRAPSRGSRFFRRGGDYVYGMRFSARDARSRLISFDDAEPLERSLAAAVRSDGLRRFPVLWRIELPAMCTGPCE